MPFFSVTQSGKGWDAGMSSSLLSCWYQPLLPRPTLPLDPTFNPTCARDWIFLPTTTTGSSSHIFNPGCKFHVLAFALENYTWTLNHWGKWHMHSSTSWGGADSPLFSWSEVSRTSFILLRHLSLRPALALCTAFNKGTFKGTACWIRLYS